MTITSVLDKKFYTVNHNSVDYTVIRQSAVNSDTPEWYVFILSGIPIENMANTELGQSLIAYCQANP
jgi:hypothetical protein